MNDQVETLGAIHNHIFTIRGIQVMLDEELAVLYGVTTKRLNEQVKRNIERFPREFCFKLTKSEHLSLRSQIATLKDKIGRKYSPYVFTEQGVAMLSAVLKSETAVFMSIKIMRAFVVMRKNQVEYLQLSEQYRILENKQQNFEIRTDQKFEKVFNALSTNTVVPKQKLFFEGAVFDAHEFVAKIIKSAMKDIILIDGFIDEEVLSMFTKREKDVDVTIYTKQISSTLLIDIKKYNTQYPKISVKEFNLSHDRFMVIDRKEIYHFGASIKDLGKKWFVVSRLEESGLTLLNRLTNMEL